MRSGNVIMASIGETLMFWLLVILNLANGTVSLQQYDSKAACLIAKQRAMQKMSGSQVECQDQTGRIVR